MIATVNLALFPNNELLTFAYQTKVHSCRDEKRCTNLL